MLSPGALLAWCISLFAVMPVTNYQPSQAACVLPRCPTDFSMRVQRWVYALVVLLIIYVTGCKRLQLASSRQESAFPCALQSTPSLYDDDVY